MTPNIESLCSFSVPKHVETKSGPRLLRKALPTPEFWEAWRANKDDMKAAGISCRKDDTTQQFEICWWIKPEGADTIMQQRAESKLASRATDAAIEIPIPPGLTYLPYQKAGIAFAYSRPATLLGDEMGLGKTIQAIGTINMDPTIENVLVICPATLKLNWRRELTKWLVKKYTIDLADGKYWPGTQIVICNYDVLRKHTGSVGARHWNMLIVDECHYIKSPKALRSKSVYAIQADRRIYMSGTPIVNRPAELFPIINSLDPVMWPKFFPFAIKFCNANRTRFGWDFKGASHLQELQDKLRSTILVRRLKADVLKELPPKRRQVIDMEADDLGDIIQREKAQWSQQEQEVEQLRADVELAKASDDPEVYKAAILRLQQGLRVSFNAMSLIRHQTAVAKIPAMVNHIHDCIDEGGKLVFFAHHHDVINAIYKAFEDCAVKLTGEMAQPDRQASVDRFQNDERCQLFIGSITAAGVGLTLTAAAHVCFGELDWVPGNVAQAEDRCHRIGQKDSVLIQFLVLDGSLDANMARKLVEKMNVIEQALDKELLEVPVDPSADHSATQNTTREEIAELARNITPDQIEAVHYCLKKLAGVCDFALSNDNAGFNGCDARIGHSLAEAPFLSVKQAALGQRMIRKYARQLGTDLLEHAGIVREGGEGAVD